MLMTALTKLRFPRGLKSENLPTVTLAIPARNETLSLVDCLNRAQALNYPKLEVIVLDDQSTDGTSDVIRGFAHAGIRFIAGREPASGWTGKTYALEQLERAASGEFVAFMNVDVRLAPDDLNYIMTLMRERNLDMVSVMPRHDRSFSLSALMEPLRYFWNVFLPLSGRRTPVGRRFWIIRRSVLAELGGISGQSYKIAPEDGLARRLMPRGTYRYYITSAPLGLRNTEDFRHELSSAVRNSYPRYKQRLSLTILGLLGHLLLLLPYLALFYPCLPTFVNVLGGVLVAVESVVATIYASLTRKSWFLAPIFWPFQLLQECLIIGVSYCKYRWGRVDWRGRDIKFIVTKPQKTPEYRPAEEYLGDFRVVRDKNRIKKHRHR
jgi:glycosyltransferase involved in cell wall biosynthesis